MTSGGDVVEPGPLGVQIGTRAHAFEFVPSADLASRGIRVELIRQRLSSLGEIAATVPRVRTDGTVAYEFSVTLRDDAVPPDAWREDGLSWEPLDDRHQLPLGLVVHESPDRHPSTPPISGSSGATTSSSVQVELSRLDDLMRMLGDVVNARGRLGALIASGTHSPSPSIWDDLGRANTALERQVRAVRNGVTRMRLVAVDEVFECVRAAMCDIARETPKVIHLDVDGQETEIDKSVSDRLLEPLLHLVRDAAIRSIESRVERIDAGKPPDGTIWLRARTTGDRIRLEVEDDGAGLDADRVARRAMDTGIRELGGDLRVASRPGHGTRFAIDLPLTRMITDAVICEVGDQVMAIPEVALREIVPLASTAVTRIENTDVFFHRGKVVPLVNLQRVFNLSPRSDVPHHVLIVGSDDQPAGLVVDRIVGRREIVAHPVSDAMIAVPGITGAAELADGRVSLILDAAALVRGGHSDRPWSR